MNQPNMKRFTVFFLVVFTASFSIHQAESVPSGASSDVKPFALTQTPQNIAALVGATIVLKCETSIAPPASRIMWDEFVTTGQSRGISDNELLLAAHPNKDRYRIIHTSDTEFHLEIRDILLRDGGKYRCQNILEAPQNVIIGEAELIVIESTPVCINTLRTNGDVDEGEKHSAVCSVGYKGKYAPIMTWSSPQPFQLTQATSDSKLVKSGIVFTVNRSIDYIYYTCLINFTDIGNVSSSAAKNTPTWEYKYMTPVLDVYWGPQNMYVEPLKKKYSVGDVLTCYADSFVPPLYQWLNMRTNEYVTSQNFTITESLANTNQTLRCKAQKRNFIANMDVSDQVFVNVNVQKKN